jgi:CSLREA domain-containing protein
MRFEPLEDRAMLTSFTVTSLADIVDAGDGVVTLREAVLAANADAAPDVINFQAGLNGTIALTGGQMTITNPVTINGNGAASTIIDAQQLSRIFDVTAAAGDVSLAGLTLTRGKTTAQADGGGAIRFASAGTLSISQSTLSGNATGYIQSPGGAIHSSLGAVVISGSTLTGNSTFAGFLYGLPGGGGAIYSASGPVTISGSTLSDNAAKTILLSSTTFIDTHGGAVLMGSGALTINSSTLSGNTVIADVLHPTAQSLSTPGGGGAVYSFSGPVTVTDSTFANNSVQGGGANGGAIATSIGNLTVTQSMFTGNSVAGSLGQGGALRTYSGSISVAQSTITGNSLTALTGRGAAIQTTSGAVNIIESTISDNFGLTAVASLDPGLMQGGAIQSRSGAISLRQSTVSGNAIRALANFGHAQGGAIYSRSGSISVYESTLSGNTALSGIASGSPYYASGGGAIHAQGGDVVISRSTLSENFAGIGNGGAVLALNGNVTISQSTLSGNRAERGGAIIIGQGALDLSQSTVVQNTAIYSGEGAGISSDGALTITNSIVAGNANFDIDEVMTINDLKVSPVAPLVVQFSMIGRNTGTNLVPSSVPDANGNLIGDEFGLNPGLGPLADNGGPTWTHVPMPDSPVRDRGSASLAVDITQLGNPALTTDQRDVPFVRNFGGGVDMGAVERQVQDLRPVLVVDNALDELDGDYTLGDLSLREAILIANQTPGIDEIHFAPEINGQPLLLTLGQLAVTDPLIVTGNGAANTVIDAQLLSRIFDVTATAGAATFARLTLAHGSADTGGAVKFSNLLGWLTVRESVLTGNIATTQGGAVYGGPVGFGGGQLGHEGFLTDGWFHIDVSDSTLSGNAANEGGAIYTRHGQLTVSRSTLSGNTAGHGGAISMRNSMLRFSQSTLSGNSAVGVGGALSTGVFTADHLISIVQSTISGNVSSDGGGIKVGPIRAGNLVSIRNSIVAGNTVGGQPQDISTFTPWLAPQYSLIGTNDGSPLAASATPDANGNLIGTNAMPIDPMLGPLADNGGPTMTHALLAGSPATDAGDPAFNPFAFAFPLVNDQRGAGFARVVNGRVDIGALEVQAPSADFDGDGDIDGRDFLLWQRGYGTPAPTAVKSNGDADNDLDVDGADLGVWQLEYGTVPAPLVAEVGIGDGDQGTVIADLGSMIVDWRAGSVSDRSTPGANADGSPYDDSYVEEIDRAIEELSSSTTLLVKPAVVPFGQMVARRGVAKPRYSGELLADTQR